MDMPRPLWWTLLIMVIVSGLAIMWVGLQMVLLGQEIEHRNEQIRQQYGNSQQYSYDV
jgi:cell division protein FtsL